MLDDRLDMSEGVNCIQRVSVAEGEYIRYKRNYQDVSPGGVFVCRGEGTAGGISD